MVDDISLLGFMHLEHLVDTILAIAPSYISGQLAGKARLCALQNSVRGSLPNSGRATRGYGARAGLPHHGMPPPR